MTVQHLEQAPQPALHLPPPRPASASLHEASVQEALKVLDIDLCKFCKEAGEHVQPTIVAATGSDVLQVLWTSVLESAARARRLVRRLEDEGDTNKNTSREERAQDKQDEEQGQEPTRGARAEAQAAHAARLASLEARP